MNKTFVAVSALIGTIIGAGFLGIPYVIMKSGFSNGMIIMLIVFTIMVLTKLYFGEIVLRTRAIHQNTGYAGKYLGKKGKMLMFFATVFGIYAAILAYLIGEGQSMSFLFYGNAHYQFQFGLIFWAVMSVIVFYGIKSLKKIEPFGVLTAIAIIFLLAVLFWDKIKISNLEYSDNGGFFLPFGVMLFAFLGYSAIPELRRIIGEEGRIMKKTILTGNFIVLTCYIIFTLIVVGAMGKATPMIATLALGKLFAVLGMITMFTAYLALAIALTDTFVYDLRKTRFMAWLYTVGIPLILFVVLEFFNKANFIRVLEVGGIISGGLTAILILAMVKKAKMNGDRHPEYSMPYSRIIIWVLWLIFIIAVLIEVLALTGIRV